jgi:hypothetical protein
VEWPAGILRCNIWADLVELLYMIIHSGYFSTPKVLISYAGFIFNLMNALNRCSFADLFPTVPKFLTSYAGLIFSPMNALNRYSLPPCFPQPLNLAVLAPRSVSQLA